MTLKFCQRCKSLMSPHKINGKNFLKCLNCNLIYETDNSLLKTSEKIDGKKELGGGGREELEARLGNIDSAIRSLEASAAEGGSIRAKDLEELSEKRMALRKKLYGRYK